MTIPFTKMHGLGNDFVVIDATQRSFALTSTLIRKMSDRRFGIGFDQLLLLEPPQEEGVDFHYRIFNSDGSEVGQCGNGARCAGKLIVDSKLVQKSIITLSTKERQLTVEVKESGLVSVNMGLPKFSPKDIPFNAPQEQLAYPLELEHQTYFIGVVNLGNPHMVLVVDDVSQVPVKSLGPKLESHPRFPEKVNVGFMQILDKAHIRLRVYERGAGETLACGSGACAAMAIGHRQNLLNEHVEVQLNGGKLNVEWKGGNEPLWMSGPAETVFKGEWLGE
ncbi:MAG: diaminopimelate epimerase [Gammaproteobacteria bacterium]|jgi:diaminopimelate epimerase|nr:diaminopimelate epimerase [Gammaproteobacteria bacterium]